MYDLNVSLGCEWHEIRANKRRVRMEIKADYAFSGFFFS